MARVLCLTLNPAIDISSEAERVQPTLKVRTRNQLLHPGGGGTNVARVIASFGGTPELVYLSGGATGQLYETLLDERDIVRRHACGMKGPVRMAYMVHEADTGFEYRFVPEGPEVGQAEIATVLQLVSDCECDFMVASGSLPRGAPEDIYAEVAAIASRKGIPLALDASGDALRIALDRGSVFLAKPSLRELEQLTGKKLDEKEATSAAASIVERGAAENVVVSMGREGAIFVNAKNHIRIPAIRVKTASAVGSGDSFLGAMVWWHLKGRPIEEAFRFGVAAGAAAAMTPGTELCRVEDVFGLFFGEKDRKTNRIDRH